MSIEITIADLGDATVIWHFRHMVIGDDVVRREYNSGDADDKLSYALAAAAGRSLPTDKSVYEVKQSSGETRYVEFTDGQVSFGTRMTSKPTT